jgi:transcriptional regulator with GAF, ATPase, and Fis domain
VRFPDEPIEVIGLRRIALETREPVVINEDIEAASAAAGQPFVLAGEPPKSSVFVPLVVGDQGTGVISLQNLDREHAFSDADVRLLITPLEAELRSRTPGCSKRSVSQQRARVDRRRPPRPGRTAGEVMFNVMGDRIQEIFDAKW